jgi:phosphoglycolate phosphatase-like HAD superfamily hydrolase
MIAQVCDAIVRAEELSKRGRGSLALLPARAEAALERWRAERRYDAHLAAQHAPELTPAEAMLQIGQKLRVALAAEREAAQARRAAPEDHAALARWQRLRDEAKALENTYMNLLGQETYGPLPISAAETNPSILAGRGRA